MTRLICLIIIYIFLGDKNLFQADYSGMYVYRSSFKGEPDIIFYDAQRSERRIERNVYANNQLVANYSLGFTHEEIAVYDRGQAAKIIDFSKTGNIFKNPLDIKCFPFVSNYYQYSGFKRYNIGNKIFRVIKFFGYNTAETLEHKTSEHYLIIQYYLDEFGLIIYQDFFNDNIIRFVKDRSYCGDKALDADKLAGMVLKDTSFFYSIMGDAIKTRKFIPPKKRQRDHHRE